MKILGGNHTARSPDREGSEAERGSLLGKAPYRKKGYGWTDDYYRNLLENCFGLSTSAALSNEQFGRLWPRSETRLEAEAEARRDGRAGCRLGRESRSWLHRYQTGMSVSGAFANRFAVAKGWLVHGYCQNEAFIGSPGEYCPERRGAERSSWRQ